MARQVTAQDATGPKAITASARYIRYSPYKLRPIADVIRGKPVTYALYWLATYPVKRALPIEKALKSAIANAQSARGIAPAELFIKEIRIDQGPIHRYFKPGAMGRANPYRKRLSHMKIILETAKEA
jgi:large subunit ribosomal protein L22